MPRFCAVLLIIALTPFVILVGAAYGAVLALAYLVSLVFMLLWLLVESLTSRRFRKHLARFHAEYFIGLLMVATGIMTWRFTWLLGVIYIAAGLDMWYTCIDHWRATTKWERLCRTV